MNHGRPGNIPVPPFFHAVRSAVQIGSGGADRRQRVIRNILLLQFLCVILRFCVVRGRHYIRTNGNRSNPKGFTLIELLVVVAIIGVLGSIAVMGARRALTASEQAACASNLKNIGAALQMYANDHNGMFPETTHTIDLNSAWIFSLEDYLGDFDETRVCPADPNKKLRLEARGTSYLLNSFIFVPTIDPFGRVSGPALNRVSAIPDPSRTIVAFICSDSTGPGPGNDHTHSNQWSSWSAVVSDISPGRFGGGSDPREATGRSNYLYVDGRVESIPAAEVKRKTEASINIAEPPGLN